MNMQEFVVELHERNFGVASFNTYVQNGENRCFIMIAEKGDTGRFLKRECVDRELNCTLQNMMMEILKLRREV